jgi:serine protease AprX
VRKQSRVTSGWIGRTAAGLTGMAVATAGMWAIATPASASPGARADVDVIVRTDGPQQSAAAYDVVRRAGGDVGTTLSLISGFTARLPENALPALRAATGVAEVTFDDTVRMNGGAWNDDSGWNSVDDIKRSGSGNWSWGHDANNNELTGQGVGVALIDSGIAPVKGLNQPGKVINGPDLSFESQTPNLRQIDTFGHGTHMAGIIAGSDPATPAGAPRFDGVAPGAHLVSLKVATADGATDVSQVVAAIDWVVQHRNDTGLNIRVLNLSFGTDSVQDAKLDPLSFAVEAAWRKGIVVVVAVGNDGPSAARVTMPAANPYVIAVGAADPNGTTARADDKVATFSTRGNATRHADLLAAGRSVVSLRAPGSYVDATYPAARLADAAGSQRLFRGSGTSQAAAVVSGSVALLLQQRPSLTPDQVKKLLTQTADPLTGADAIAAGAGQLDIAQAMSTSASYYASQKFTAATGLGSLEGARGTAHVADSESGVVLSGEKDIFGAAWTPAKWAPLAAGGKAWTGGTWNGNVWTGAAFGDTSWASKTWTDVPWTARTWSGQSWTARTWSAAVWDGAGWTARTWSGRTWSGRTWSGASWQ